MSAAFGPLSLESPAPGLAVYQPRRGYRWGVEVYALVGFALGIGAPAPVAFPPRVLELGAGSGIVSLLLASRGCRVRGWERDAEWVALARRSLRRSPAARGRVRFSVRDVRVGGGAAADVVVTNPPWFDPGAGPSSPDPRKASARTMLHGTVDEFVAIGLAAAPRVCVVTRVERLAGLRLDNAHVARRAWLRGAGVGVVEVRRGAGQAVEEALDLPTIYAQLRYQPGTM